MLKLGFIGTGNMGGALARAAAKSAEPVCIMLSNRTAKKAERLAEEIAAAAGAGKGAGAGIGNNAGGVAGAGADSGSRTVRTEVCDNKKVAAEADYIFLGVKPQMMADMLSGISGILKERMAGAAGGGSGNNNANGSGAPVLVTMAAGLSIDAIAGMAGTGDIPIIRIMPNTPAAIGKGMILYATGSNVTAEMRDRLLNAMAGAGRFSELPENLIDAGSAVSGCGPAYVYMFAEALADGGVACGLPRAKAIEYAAQMIAGSAELILESGQHPGALKDAVCSPGGTTIQGVRKLEESAFRGAVMDAVIAAYDKTIALKQ